MFRPKLGIIKVILDKYMNYDEMYMKYNCSMDL
jgi:hypothetical protein